MSIRFINQIIFFLTKYFKVIFQPVLNVTVESVGEAKREFTK